MTLFLSQDGPWAQRAVHDLNYTALAGVIDLIGPADGPPVMPLNLISDFGGGGMLIAFGILAALHERSQSGKGQVVDAAMVEGCLTLLASTRSEERRVGKEWVSTCRSRW